MEPQRLWRPPLLGTIPSSQHSTLCRRTSRCPRTSRQSCCAMQALGSSRPSPPTPSQIPCASSRPCARRTLQCHTVRSSVGSSRRRATWDSLDAGCRHGSSAMACRVSCSPWSTSWWRRSCRSEAAETIIFLVLLVALDAAETNVFDAVSTRTDQVHDSRRPFVRFSLGNFFWEGAEKKKKKKKKKK